MMTSCGTVRNYSHNSRPKIIAEKTKLTIDTTNKNTHNQKNFAGVVGLAAALAPTVIDFGTTIISQSLKVDEADYTGTYKASNSQEGFYTENDGLALPQLRFEREIVLNEKPDALTPAVLINLVPEMSKDSTAFRYKIDNDNFKYQYSIAKLKGAYNYIDLHLEIKIRSLSVNANKYELNDIRTVTMVIPTVKVSDNAKVTDEIFSGWIPLFPKSSIDIDTVKNIIEEKEKEITDENGITKKTTEKITSVKVPKTIKYTPIPSGVYEIEVMATEVNIAKMKAEQRAKLFDETSESGGALLKAIVEQLTKKPDEEKE
ncbi:hypothetical protein C5749_05755 [Sphingobacterium gobiense]|uniref:Uncharacterized protein n=2 Tax=Sphingobacterium gobiense TaxID=1382456 RepID=A0A2S9JTZ9_9SPHI|nr:hypothetical protein C5749_05755 [Sphingobacterium gobiense]